MDVARFTAWREAHGAAVRDLYVAADAARWNVPETAWAESLFASACSRFPSGGSSREVRAYLGSLHLADLALACACRSGDPSAWDHFVVEQRPALYAAARALAGDEEARAAIALCEQATGLVCDDPVRFGAERLWRAVDEALA